MKHIKTSITAILLASTLMAQTLSAEWNILESIDPMDDTTSAFCFIEADKPVRVGYQTVLPYIAIVRSPSGVSAHITYPGVFLGSDTMPVTIRYGKDKAETSSSGISTDYETVFGPMDLLSRLKSVDSVLVRLTPYGESSVTVSFQIPDMDEMVAAMEAATVD